MCCTTFLAQYFSAPYTTHFYFTHELPSIFHKNFFLNNSFLSPIYWTASKLMDTASDNCTIRKTNNKNTTRPYNRFLFSSAYKVSLTAYSKDTQCITHQVFTIKKEIKTLYQTTFLSGRLRVIDWDHNMNIMLILQKYVCFGVRKLNYSCNRYQLLLDTL